ncbi:hypothetical protein DFP72DRAFT_861523 [Ephemerocybe angulata]|uniref:Uncharacterized protein n=1 Tax=Ephemerocybe angulata TaxID=980116 RepID=A0A8H6LT67_9AGAR|nr:hypothetical protein DFP72DRAFT_861523 [Tulosesus angulatus]
MKMQTYERVRAHATLDQKAETDRLSALIMEHAALMSSSSTLPQAQGQDVVVDGERLDAAISAAAASSIPLPPIDIPRGVRTFLDLERHPDVLAMGGSGTSSSAPDISMGGADDFEPLESPHEPEPPEPLDDPICNDDWECPEVLDGDPLPPPPPLPPPQPPVIVQSAPLSSSSVTPQALPAVEVPLHKALENNPDPFLTAKMTAPPAPPQSKEDIHPHRGIYLLYMLVSWLHLQFHLPFRACDALVVVSLIIIKSFGVTFEGPKPITTFRHILARLDLEPEFDVLPICKNCWEVHPGSPEQRKEACVKCQTPLFKAKTRRWLGLKDGPPPSPLLQVPYMSLQSQLATIISVSGVEAMLDKWRIKLRHPDRYTDIFDGDVTKQLKAPDGTNFFREGAALGEGPDGELRIGLTLGLDWFSYIRTNIAPSHSSAPVSFSIANLPTHLRYRTSNLLLVGIMPGPKEQGPDETHRYLRVSVNELLRLWKDGFTVITQSSPNGRLPAAHKVGGFGAHSHTFFCTQCWITQANKSDPAAFQKNGFRARTDVEHRLAGSQYAELKTDATRKAFVEQNAARWSEFARLPYFDLVKMVVIDPMHNLLLGLVKTHFYHIWVQMKILRKTEELKALHTFLSEFQMPSWVGRLPTQVGEPAGGSLTADQWMLLATVIGPIAVPQIWDKFMGDPEAARAQRANAIQKRLRRTAKEKQAKQEKAAIKKAENAAKAAAKKAENEAEKSRVAASKPPTKRPSRKRPRTDGDAIVSEEGAPTPAGPSTSTTTALPVPPLSSTTDATTGKPGPGDKDGDEDEVPGGLHPGDPQNFLKLAKALRLLLKRDIHRTEVDEAERLLIEYCSELGELYGPDVYRPNHHYAVHTPDGVRWFGPFHEFWTFLFERLNKVLKGYKTNNRDGGELETTFFREFHRTVAMSRVAASSRVVDEDGMFKAATDAMFKASQDDRGTLQTLAKELDGDREDEGVSYDVLSSRHEDRELGTAEYIDILKRFQAIFGALRLRSVYDAEPPMGTRPLPIKARFLHYAVVNGRRYHASNLAESSSNSFVEVIVSDVFPVITRIGELTDIIQIAVTPEECLTIGRFRWFDSVRQTIDGRVVTPTPWDSL